MSREIPPRKGNTSGDTLNLRRLLGADKEGSQLGLEETRQALRSAAPIVLVEAPAGCGKTYESVSAALDLSHTLEPDQQVLLLAHTNTAVQTFRKRIGRTGAKVQAMTLDSFALEHVAPYAPYLGLPVPLRVDTPDGVPFAELAKHLNELYRRSPTIARATAERYPVIILDEHQDASNKQHEVISTLSQVGYSRLRMFGDPMQAIYGFGASDLVQWESLARDASVTAALTQPHRWTDAPELGQWISEARVELIAGRRLPLANAPKPFVNVKFIEGLPDMGNPNSIQPPLPIIGPVHRLLDQLNGSVAIVTRYNNHVLGVYRAIGRRIKLNEGAEFTVAYTIVQQVVGALGDPQAMCKLLINLLKDTSSGCDLAFQKRVGSRLDPGSIRLANAGKLTPFLLELQSIYSEPSMSSWCQVVESVRRDPPDGVSIEWPDCLRLIGSLRCDENADPIQALDEACRYRRLALAQPKATVSTIHKVKGQEYDHVIICHCNSGPFPDNESARKLLYVALSRARLSVTILASRSHPSPLIA